MRPIILGAKWPLGVSSTAGSVTPLRQLAPIVTAPAGEC